MDNSVFPFTETKAQLSALVEILYIMFSGYSFIILLQCHTFSEYQSETTFVIKLWETETQTRVKYLSHLSKTTGVKVEKPSHDVLYYFIRTLLF